MDANELEVVCGAYGEASVFIVTVPFDADVSALQEAIAREMSTPHYAVPPHCVTPYVARQPDGGTWLKCNDDLETLLRAKINRTTSYTKLSDSPQSKLLDVEVLGPEFQTLDRHDAVHILVALPNCHLSADPRWHEVHESLLRHVLLDPVRPPSSSKSRKRSDKKVQRRFKKTLCAAYDADYGGGGGGGTHVAPGSTVRCLLLDMALPSTLVVATHLFRRCNAFLCDTMMGFSDVDDVRNGLLLFAPLAHALEQFQVSFIYDGSSDAFRFTIFDPSLRETRLVDTTTSTLDDTQRAMVVAAGTPCHGVQTTTFGDLEGRALCFRSSLVRPYKRCLNLQARLARKKALEEKWISLYDHDFADFWCEGMTLTEKMEWWHEYQD